jgi:twitching motility protein PilT
MQHAAQRNSKGPDYKAIDRDNREGHMSKIDKYFDELLNLNAVQLSLKPKEPAQYVMASGRQFEGRETLTAAEIENMLNEIIDGGIDLSAVTDEINVQYELAEKGAFTGLIEKKGDRIFSSFVLLDRYKTVDKSIEKSVGNAMEEESGNPLEMSVKVHEGEPEIHRYLRVLVENNGSDLHISSNEYPFIRKDGRLIKVKEFSILSSSDVQRLIGQVMGDSEKKSLDNNDDADFSYHMEGYARFRCNVFKDLHGFGAAFRLIPFRIPSFEELRLPEIFKEMCFLNKGLILVTGPTGSGKSTSLSALIDFINRKRDVHIITLEDPIEFVHKNMKALINQREIKKHATSFSSALKSALREDPDVVLVGEMRDLETISIALETAETGHLVLATLHTTSAYSTINRIIEQYPPDQQEQIKTMLADSLKAVISQTLCRKIGGGRIAAFEILLATPAISNIIREGKTYQIPSIIQTRKKEGMISLNDYLMTLVDGNLIETYEAYLCAIDKKGIIAMLKARGYKTDFLSRLDLLD